MTYADTFLFIASNDTSLPANTKEKCQSLRLLDAGKPYDYPNLKMKVVKNTDHQFDYCVGSAVEIPFPDQYFDFATAIMSLVTTLSPEGE